MVGDQFLLIYSQVSSNTPAATLFTIGHAAELYLKAVALHLAPTKAAKSYGHGLSGLLDLMHANGLLLSYTVKESIRDTIMNRCPHPIETMSDPDFLEYTINQELYWVAYYLSDIKYLGSEHIRAPETFGVTVMSRNPYWIPFFKELRQFLDWPTQSTFFASIAPNISHGQMPNDAKAYLAALG